MSTQLYEDGMQARRKVLGDAYVDRASAGADAFNAEFQRMVTEYCWGAVWARTTLGDRQRSLINLSGHLPTATSCRLDHVFETRGDV